MSTIQTITGPYTHENLTVFLVHSSDRIDTSRYVTLAEALEQQKVIVHETGNVRELFIENLFTDKDVFIQAGEILRGGRQDRAIGVDLVVPAASKLPLPTFCVEMGRWHPRGAESAAAFSSTRHYLSSKALKLAAKMKASQHEVWDQVAETQAKLRRTLAAPVHAAESPSSLELTLDNEHLAKRRQQFVAALAGIVEARPDTIGFVFAINGQLNSAETYASPELFRKLWTKLLESAVVEALAEAGDEPAPVPLTEDAVRQFLAQADDARAHTRSITDRVSVHIKRTRQTIVFETEDKAQPQARLHKNYINDVTLDE
ncbi:MAG: DUF6569 family protein [Verrucomicrobiae bacterium]|nr:DUF6569 family protein [Verrucomicrobiae bacterium]